MIDRKLLALLFIVVALFASMETRPRTLVLTIAMSEDSPSPLNKGDYGSSILAEALEGEGFEVVVVPGTAELLGAAGRYNRIVVIVVGSDYLSEDVGRATAEAVRALADSGSLEWIGVIVADEAPGEGARAILEASQEAICGTQVIEVGDTFNAPLSIAEFYLAPGPLRITTGYVAPLYSTAVGGIGYAVIPPGTPTPVKTPQRLEGAVEAMFIGYAWPSTTEPRGLWFPVAGFCGGPKGRVVVVGDSTMFLNRTLAGSPEALRAAVGLVKLASGGGKAAVIFVQEHYVSEENLSSVAVRILPSILLISLASAYSSLEESILDAIASSGPLTAAFAASLAFIAWALMPLFQERERVKVTGKPSLKARAKDWVLRLRKLARLAA